MNDPEILHLIRHDLQRAVADRGEPSPSQPMNASPWLAMSAMQKAIRRGREDLALSAAATLLRDAPDKLWRRLGCIAYEDVGIAALDAVGIATVSLGGKQARAALGEGWAVATCVVAKLSQAPKCRAADDLLMACELHPAYTEARVELPLLTTRHLIETATGRGSVQERALALWYALGTDRDRSRLAPRRGDPRAVFEQLCEAGWPHTIVEVAREGFRRTRTVLCPLVALLSCELPPEVMIGDAPSWALDVYTREGRAAFARFLQTDAPPLDGYSATSVRRAEYPSSGISSSGWRAALSPIECGGRWPRGFAAKSTSSARAQWPDATEILGLMADDIPLLNEVRAAVMGMPQG